MTSQPGPVIEVADVTRTFGDLTAVRDVGFTVDRGEILGLLGHNGAGKTTLIRLINGILRPDHGRIRVDGRDPVEDGAAVRSNTGVVTSFPALDGLLDAHENLRVHAAIRGLDAAAVVERGTALLDELGLGTRAQVSTDQLSTGLQQRVALARALLHDPDVLLLDEPTANMDPVAAVQVRDLIADLNRERRRTVVLCTHNLAEAQALCDRVVILRDGRVLAAGTPDELARRADMDAVQLTVARDDVARVHELLGVPAEDRGPGVVEAAVDRRRVPALLRRLVAAGVEVYAVQPRGGTLEEVYLHLHADEQQPADRPPPPTVADAVSAGAGRGQAGPS